MGIIHHHEPRTKLYGMSYGEGYAGYDIRIAEGILLVAGHATLGVTIEKFTMPSNVIGIVHDKSTLARLGVAVRNTVLEPGWDGHLTVEVSYLPLLGQSSQMSIQHGSPIAQVIFHLVDAETEGYSGKYQNAGPVAQRAILEVS